MKIKENKCETEISIEKDNINFNEFLEKLNTSQDLDLVDIRKEPLARRPISR